MRKLVAIGVLCLVSATGASCTSSASSAPEKAHSAVDKTTPSASAGTASQFVAQTRQAIGLVSTDGDKVVSAIERYAKSPSHSGVLAIYAAAKQLDSSVHDFQSIGASALGGQTAQANDLVDAVANGLAYVGGDASTFKGLPEQVSAGDLKRDLDGGITAWNGAVKPLWVAAHETTAPPTIETLRVTTIPSLATVKTPPRTSAAPTTSPKVTYKITGNGSQSSDVTYVDSDGSIQQDTDVRLPYRKRVSPGSDYYSVSAQDQDGSSISCEIIDSDGTVLSKHTAHGQYAIVECQSTS